MRSRREVKLRKAYIIPTNVSLYNIKERTRLCVDDLLDSTQVRTTPIYIYIYIVTMSALSEFTLSIFLDFVTNYIISFNNDTTPISRCIYHYRIPLMQNYCLNIPTLSKAQSFIIPLCQWCYILYQLKT